ncbi:EmrB/QacA subfamily drug resistance transporter [Streptosporangium becharense]|uniref:EmrB/QacA subfamily drug resistance transporter n=1 Tax=Streptosporangium becharense TaxID=1816182 RepID=A0A7W9MHT3_9ACTN|nr:MFS transporter [Streptosporangium becharense]MBB2912387.1 EmrB/QacA subfamily drug resistance transporter [Streptosporangium becharense]MBB5820784.1 EmrB/QacA subfamily drug resistance transporter [Streptosporangium becharense]
MVAVPQDLPGSPEYLSKLRYAWRVCSVTSLGMVLIGVSGSTLNVALPAVVRHFRADAFASGWVLLSFLLVNTASLVFFGRVADLLGRREIYLAGFALFTAGSLLAGLSPGVWFLIAMRVVQAVGAAMILANGTVIITDAFPPDRLSQGMGVYIGTLSVAQLAGPTLGGLVADIAGWQWIFWVNVPAGLVALTWGAFTLRRAPRGPRRPVDAPGNLIVFAVLSAALIALSEAGSRGLNSPVVLAGAAVAVALVPVLVFVERRSPNPVLDMRLFGDRMLAFANAASFCNALARAALVLLVALYFQAARGVDAVTAALGVLPVPIGMALASPVAGAAGRRVPPYALSVGGALMSTAGLGALFLTVDPATPYWIVGAGLFLCGCGSGTFLTGNTTQVMSALPAGSMGVVNGFRLMIMNVGIVLSVALTLSVLTGSVSAGLRAQVYAGTLSRVSPVAVEQLMDGFRNAYAMLFAVALAGTLTAALARTRRDPGAP